MAVVSSPGSRVESRDVYVPAYESGMGRAGGCTSLPPRGTTFTSGASASRTASLNRSPPAPRRGKGSRLSADGRSVVTAMSLRRRPITFHDASGDRQASLEGYALAPRLYLPQASELWAGDVDSGCTEPSFPASA